MKKNNTKKVATAYFCVEEVKVKKQKRKDQKERRSESASCSVCEKTYPAGIQYNQGFGIASSLYGSGVISYFGSEFDGDIHMFYEPIEQDVEDLFTGTYYPICDECIQDLIDRNLIGLVKSTFG